MPPPVFLYGFAKAQEPGRFAWHHKALISLRIRREEAPRPLRRMERGFPFPRNIQADAAGANRPGSWAPTKVRQGPSSRSISAKSLLLLHTS
ncbi:MAG: hypothetical protein OEW45_10945 [Deltaproteobacteria bacterium]|nr:hypothetical protein [Deltaproteobacteria bacterium]